MKRRFTETLLAVAIAVVGSSAFAMAPTISNPGYPVISDDDSTTDDNYIAGQNLFVWADAIDLDSIGNDPDGTVATDQIIWSYAGTGGYLINGVDPIDPAVVSPNAPGNRIDTTDDDPEGAAGDGNPRTITLRDAMLSPIGGPNTDPFPTGTTSQTVRSAAVTLFASDGSSWSMQQMLIYTEDDGRDRMSGDLTLVSDVVPANATGANAWTSAVIVGNASQMTNTGSALCIQGTLTPDTFAQWIGPYGFIELVQNQVYRLRVEMGTNGTNIPANTAPLWDIVLDNVGPDSLQAYGFDFYNYDNEGGANSVGNLDTFDVWWTPLAVKSDGWNDPTSGVFTAANDPRNDGRVIFRMLDTQGAINANADAGTVCLERIQVHRMPIDSLAVTGTPYSQTNLTQSNYIVASTIPNTTDVVFANGDISITPSTATSWNVEVINVDPGNAVTDTEVERQDNWPVEWVPNQLHMGTISIQAASAATETNPPDAIMLTVDSPTSELFWVNQMYAGATTVGFPVLAEPTDYVTLFYTHEGTASTLPGGDGLRVRAQILNTPNINSGGNTENTAGIVITGAQVQTLAVPQ